MTGGTGDDPTLGGTSGSDAAPSGLPQPGSQGGLGSDIGSRGQDPGGDVSLTDEAGGTGGAGTSRPPAPNSGNPEPGAADPGGAVHEVSDRQPDALPGQGGG